MTSICPACGSTLGVDAPMGLCPACLVRKGAEEIFASAPVSFERQVFGDYELEEEIARGGMGVVYRARQLSLQRMVAVKMILYGRFAGQDQVQRLRAEASAAASLRHPNIVTVHEVGEHEGQPFLAMEYVAGQSLAEIVRDQPLTAARAARYLEASARAIHVAHQQRILHRDLKPSNILIDTEDQPRITDFGLAKRFGIPPSGGPGTAQAGKADELSGDSEIAGVLPAEAGTPNWDLTISGQPLGTPGYMPPEQVAVKRGKVGPWSDIYSLGAILYHLLTGRPPFLADTLPQTFAQILNNEPVSPRVLSPAVPRDLETICLKCLAKEPARRYASAGALADELGRFLRNEPIHARPATALEKTWRWCERRPKLASLLTGTALALLAALAVSVSASRRAETANRRVVSTLELTETQLADRDLEGVNALAGLSALAKVVRENPYHRVAVNRLFSALNHRAYAMPIGSRLHGDEVVWSADLSTDEQRVVTTVSGNDAFVWDLSDLHAGPPSGSPAKTPPGGWTPNHPLAARLPKLLHRLGHTNGVDLARFSPDGKLIVTACADKRLRLWDTDAGTQIGRTFEHDDEIYSVCFSKDGRELLSSQSDGAVFVWDVAGGRRRLSLPPPKNPPPGASSMVPLMRIHDFAPATYSPDGRRILSIANSRTARIWDVTTGRLQLELQHEDLITTADFSADGSKVVTSACDRTIRVWNTRTGAPIALMRSLPTQPAQAHFSPDGSKVAAGFFDNTVLIWDAGTGERFGPALSHKHNIEDLSFSGDGRFIIVAVHDGAAHIWDVSSGRPVISPIRASGSLRAARFLLDGARFFTRGSGGWQLWKIGQPEKQAMTFAPETDVRAARFLEGEREILTMGMDFNGRIWDRATGQPLTPILEEPGRHFGRPIPIDIFPPKFAADALAWERKTHRRLIDFLRPDETLYNFAVSPEGQRLALGFLNGGERLIDLAHESEPPTTISNSGIFACVQFSSDSRRIVLGSTDGTAHIFDMAQGTALSPALRHPGEITGLALSADGRWLITWGYFSGAYLWDTSEPKPAARRLAHESEVNCARFDERSERVVTASYDHTVRIWDVANARQIARTLTHQSDVPRAQFTPDGMRVATVCADGTARLWDAATGLAMSEPLRCGATLDCIDLSADSRFLLCGGRVAGAHLWEILEAPLPAPAWLPELAEALAGKRLREDGMPESLPSGVLNQVQEKLRALSDDDFYTRWAKQRFLQGERPDR